MQTTPPPTPPTSAPASTEAPPAGGPPQSVLRQAIQHNEKQVPGQMGPQYDAIVKAGMKLMFSPGMYPQFKQEVAKIQTEKDVPAIVARGICWVLAKIYEQSQKKMDWNVAPLAATTLMCQVLEHIEAIKKIQITPQLIALTSKVLMGSILKMLNVSQEQVNEVLSKGPQKGPQPGAQPGAAPAGPTQPGGLINQGGK